MKKFSYNIIMSIALLLAMTVHSSSQGSIANRDTVGASCMRLTEIGDSSGWLLNINNRYFNSVQRFYSSRRTIQKSCKRNGAYQSYV